MAAAAVGLYRLNLAFSEMNMKSIELNDHTKIPVSWIFGLVAFILPLLVGGIVWLTTLYSMVAQATQKSDKAEARLDKEIEMLINIDKRLSRIEDKLNIKK